MTRRPMRPITEQGVYVNPSRISPGIRNLEIAETLAAYALLLAITAPFAIVASAITWIRGR